MDKIAVIAAELTNDPLGRGYAGMTDEQATASLQVKDRSVMRDTMTSSEIFEAIDPAEFAALSSGDKVAIQTVLGLGEGVKIGPSSKARAFLLAAFGPGTNTRTDLATVASETKSRAEELGITRIHLGDVQNARAL